MWRLTTPAVLYLELFFTFFVGEVAGGLAGSWWRADLQEVGGGLGLLLLLLCMTRDPAFNQPSNVHTLTLILPFFVQSGWRTWTHWRT